MMGRTDGMVIQGAGYCFLDAEGNRGDQNEQRDHKAYLFRHAYILKRVQSALNLKMMDNLYTFSCEITRKVKV